MTLSDGTVLVLVLGSCYLTFGIFAAPRVLRFVELLNEIAEPLLRRISEWYSNL